MKILKLILDNFKGNKHSEYDLSDRMIVRGKNGVGKSTLMSAWLWLIANIDSVLTSNPVVRPNDAIDENVVSVTAQVDFDGKPVELQKSQKLKRSKTGTVSLTNSYMINSVPKSEKDFKSYLVDLGVDFDKFLPCSHPNVMLAGINNKKERTALRNTLFQMASDITDLDVAQNDDDLQEIASLLADYDAGEIEAMQNNTLRKIRENYGREGEILRAKIEGLDSAKVEVDADSHKAEIERIDDEIADTESKIQALNEEIESIKKIGVDAMELKFKLSDIEREAMLDRNNATKKAENDLYTMEKLLSDKNHEVDILQNKIEDIEAYIKDTRKKKAINEEKAEQIGKQEFDEALTICPTCGQKLPEDKVEELKVNFNNNRDGKLAKFREAIEYQASCIKKAEKTLVEHKNKVSENNKDYQSLSQQIKYQKKLLDDIYSIPKPDMSENKEYQKTLKEIQEKESAMAREDELVVRAGALESHKLDLLDEKYGHKKELDKAEINKETERKIAQLREDQNNYEQQKANAEMILDQLKTLNMKKNTMLQDEVNSHFNLIEWVLFTQQKNGEYKDACIPTIKGKRFGESMNTALEIMAKIDAMNGIQKFFGLDYPIFLDDAEHLDSESMKQIKTDHQLIMLCVSDDEELVFEKGGEE